MFPDDILDKAQDILTAATEKSLMLATVESCTGGLVAGALTTIPGSASAVECGFVTYSNQAKTAMVGVPAQMLEDFGAVSEPVARAMASGALNYSRASVAVSITGVAGPSGGSELKPVGLVHFAIAGPNGVHHVERSFGDIGRDAVRLASVRQALDMLFEEIERA